MQLWWLIALLFLMGAQSTFIGPLKYSVLPQLLREDELVAGNGLVNAGTNVAILTGTLCGGLFIMSPLGRYYISAGIVGVAAAGYIASRFIPVLPASSPSSINRPQPLPLHVAAYHLPRAQPPGIHAALDC